MAIREGIELKVGIFVLVGIIILSVIVSSIGKIELFRKGYNIKLRFNDAGGIEVGAPVNLLGVRIGEVKSINFIYNKRLGRIQIELLLWIKQGIKIGDDTTAKIRRLGLMGEKYIDLAPSNPKAETLKENGILYGQNPITIEDMTEKIYLASDEIKKAVFYMNDILGDKTVREDFKQTVKNAKEASGQLNELVADIKKHPWKLFIKTKDEKKQDSKKGNKGYIIQKGS